MKTTIIILIFAATCIFGGVAGAQNVEYAGSTLWSDVREVEVIDDYAYCAFLNGLMILDVSDAESPSFVGQYYLEGEGRSIDVEGDYAYLADGPSGLQIIDVSDPSQPLWVGRCDNDTVEAHSVFVSGDYAYVSYSYCVGYRPPECYGYLLIIDITDPANPITVGSYGLYEVVDDVFVSGNYAYLTRYNSGWEYCSGGFHIIDVSDPTNPVPVSSEQGHCAPGIYVQENYAYVAFGDYGLDIFDISDSYNPIWVGNYNYGVNVRDVFVLGEYAYVVDHGYGLQIINVNDPAEPYWVGSCETTFDPRDVFVLDNFAYVSNGVYGASGVSIIDINNPAEPSLIGNFETPSEIDNVFASDNNACVSTSSSIEIIDINDLSEPVWVGGYWTPDFRDMFINNQYLYLLETSYLMTIDISIPSNPILIDVLNPGDGLRGMFVSGDYLYLADQYSGLITFDLSDPTNPLLAGVCGLQDFCNSVFVTDDIALLTGDYYLHLVDVNDPYDPAWMASVQTDDASNVIIVGEYAYVKVRSGFQIFDITDPLHPELAGSYDDSNVENFFVSGDFAFLARRSGEIRIINISDPAYPQFVANYYTPGQTYDVFIEDPYIFLADYTSFIILHFDPQTGIIEKVSAPEQFSLSQNYPNPFNASTSISFALPQPGDVRLVVYDLLGRQVETLLDGYRPAGTHRITFDASDYSSGVYFYRVQAGERVETKRMLLLK